MSLWTINTIVTIVFNDIKKNNSLDFFFKLNFSFLILRSLVGPRSLNYQGNSSVEVMIGRSTLNIYIF